MPRGRGGVEAGKACREWCARRVLPLNRNGVPGARQGAREQLRLWKLRLEARAHSRGNRLDRCRIGDEVVLPHVEAQYRTGTKARDPPLVPGVQRRPVLRWRLAFLRAAPRADALHDGVQRRVQVNEKPRRARRGRVQQLHVQPAIELPFELGHQPFVVVSPREDLGVLVPRTVEHPAATCASHATHALESRGEEVKLQVERRRAHRFHAASVEPLEPGVVLIHALEGVLQPEPRRERARQRALARADHSGDADQPGRKLRRRRQVRLRRRDPSLERPASRSSGCRS